MKPLNWIYLQIKIYKAATHAVVAWKKWTSEAGLQNPKPLYDIKPLATAR